MPGFHLLPAPRSAYPVAEDTAVLRYTAGTVIRQTGPNHQQFAHPVPDRLTDDAAALLEPLSVGLSARFKGGVGAGSRGAGHGGSGPVGRGGDAGGRWARAPPSPSVAVNDANPHRLALAGGSSSVPRRRSTWCATPVFLSGLADVALAGVLGAPGRPTADAIRAVCPGRLLVVLVGMGGDEAYAAGQPDPGA